MYFKTTWLKQGSLSACFTFEPKKRFGGATWLFLKIKHKNGNWCLPLGQSHVESPHPPSFIVYIHTPGKVVILERPSLFLTSLSARKFISSEIGRFQLCGGNLTNIIRLESLGTCVMSSSFWISLSTRCVAYWWKPRKPAVCFWNTLYFGVVFEKSTQFFSWERLNSYFFFLQTFYSSRRFRLTSG